MIVGSIMYLRVCICAIYNIYVSICCQRAQLVGFCAGPGEPSSLPQWIPERLRRRTETETERSERDGRAAELEGKIVMSRKALGKALNYKR